MKTQVLQEPIKCWVKDSDYRTWVQRWLVAVNNNDKHKYIVVSSITHGKTPTMQDALMLGTSRWCLCVLNNPYVQTPTWQEYQAYAITHSAHIQVREAGHDNTSWMDAFAYDYTAKAGYEFRSIRWTPSKVLYGEVYKLVVNVINGERVICVEVIQDVSNTEKTIHTDV